MSEPPIDLVVSPSYDPTPYDPNEPARGGPRPARQNCAGSLVQVMEACEPTQPTVVCPICLRTLDVESMQVGKEDGERVYYAIVRSHLPDRAGLSRAAVVRSNAAGATPRPW